MIGQTISHYKILEKLGEGGMGVVYKAEDLRLKRNVAVKFLPKRLSVHGEERERFIHEAQAASALNHPNICVIHEIDEVNDESFIVMEYMDGITLREWIRKKAVKSEGYRKLSLKEAIDLATQIAEGLERAHEKGIIHRDVKSENIMVTTDGRAKIMDFGLAKLKGVSKLTKTGSTVGTVAYMSPEQVEGIETDHRTDIFSFGVVIYEMLAGHLPFRAEHETAMMYEIINVEPKSLIDQHKDIDPELSHIVMKCLEKDREERYQSMREVAVDLKRYKRDSEGRRIERKADVRGMPQPSAPTLSVEGLKIKRLKIGLVSFVVIVLIVLGIYLLIPKTTKIDSIAVLPFENVGADPNTEYLSDGITESLINTLSQLSNLTVMSRSSVFHYKGIEIDPQKVGKELGVKAILVGRVSQQGDNFQISTELVDVSNNSHIWGEQYNKKFSDMFIVQEEISKEISHKLSLKLASEDEKKLTRRSTENTEAYQLYLKGRYHWNKRLPNDLHKGIQYFQEALAKDPGYARAYAGLADSYIILGDYNIRPPHETYPRAKEAAQKALQIDPEIPEAHTSLAYAIMRYDWDWSWAEKEFHLAIELAPNSGQAHSWYALYLSLTGRYDDAVTEIKQACALDPFSAVIRTDAGLAFYFSRQYDFAIEQLREALEMDPAFVVANIPLGGAYVQKKMYPEAIAAFEQLNMASALVTSKGNPVPIAALAYVYGVSGRKEDALMYIELLQEKSKDEYVAPYWMAAAYAGVGNIEEEFRWLEKAYEERDGNIIFLKAHPIFDQLHGDPRFTALVEKIGLVK